MGPIARATILAVALSIGTFEAANHPTSAHSDATPVLTGCTVAPRSPHDIFALLQRSNVATPAATTEGSTLPQGSPASASDRKEVEDSISTWLACQNAGEPLRAWSQFTDGYLYRLLSREAGLTRVSLARLATPTPSSADPAVIDLISDVRLLPDGRLGATVTISYPTIPMPKRFFFYFVRDDNGLLIDSVLGEISFSVP